VLSRHPRMSTMPNLLKSMFARVAAPWAAGTRSLRRTRSTGYNSLPLCRGAPGAHRRAQRLAHCVCVGYYRVSHAELGFFGGSWCCCGPGRRGMANSSRAACSACPAVCKECARYLARAYNCSSPVSSLDVACPPGCPSCLSNGELHATCNSAIWGTMSDVYAGTARLGTGFMER